MHLRVLHLLAGTERKLGGCEVYRTVIPAQALKANGHVVEYEWLGNIVKYGNKTSVEHVIDRLVKSYDIFVFPRVTAVDRTALELMYHFFSVLRLLGKKIVYEVDDDYTNTYRHVTTGYTTQIAAWADIITVTTPYLAKLMRKITHRPTFILPNCLPPKLWKDGEAPQRLLHHDKLIIGLTGSETHVKDWQVVVEPLRAILNEHANVHLITMGLHLDALGDHPQITRLGWSEYTVYSQVIRGCDIILAPVLPDDGFNISKSPIKAVEGQAAERKVNGTSTGAAVIATNNPVYRLAIQDQDNGLLVSHTERAWYGAIKTLVEQDHTRVRLQDRGYKSAWKRFDITKEWKQWSVAYNTALSLKNSPVMSITEVNNNVP